MGRGLVTAYFDRTSASIAALTADSAGYDAIRDIEFRLVRDVRVCAEMPGFPDDLRNAVDVSVLTRGIYSRPRPLQPGDADDFADHRRKLVRLSEDFHTVFHEVARRGLPRFSDSPTCPVSCMAADGENRQDNMAAGVYLLDKLLPWLLTK